MRTIVSDGLRAARQKCEKPRIADEKGRRIDGSTIGETVAMTIDDEVVTNGRIALGWIDHSSIGTARTMK
jgi:hypothetical protein